LLGPNGAGKSTALKIALNLLRPSTGHVEILGIDSRKLGPAQLERIGYVAEGMELPDWMTVDQFLAWCRPLYPKWDADLERSLRKQFSLPGDRKLKHLSRGQRMKAALIAALAYRPELLVLDEPFSGLDPLVRDEFITGLLELAGGEGFSVVLSSHDIEEVDRLADHVVLLNHGAVLLDEDTEPLLARHRRVEILLPPDFGALPHFPATWIAPQSAGRVLRFTDTAYDPKSFAETTTRLFPGCPQADVHPLTLRELFVTLVRAGRADAGV
jgi:ABC-2 type transport system ATP-binding protein